MGFNTYPTPRGEDDVTPEQLPAHAEQAPSQTIGIINVNYKYLRRFMLRRMRLQMGPLKVRKDKSNATS